MLSFVPLGVGDAFSARWYSSCLLVESGDARLLVDCPHPIRKLLRESEAGVDVADIDAVFLTHLHADHASGLEGFGYFCRFALGRRGRLVTHPDVKARLWAGHLAAGMEQLMDADQTVHSHGFDDYFEYIPVTEESAVEIGPFRISCRSTIHHVPTTALRIEAGGRLLAYSADTAFDPSLIRWMEGADLIIHETNYGVHTPYARLAALPAELRSRMRLIHYPDDFDLAGSQIEPLEQGRRYTV